MTTSMTDLALRVPYHGDLKMVGKFFVSPSRASWVFYHLHDGGDEGLHLLENRHGGVDAAVVRFLQEQPVQNGRIVMRAVSDPTDTFWVADWQTFLRDAVFKPLADRFRLFLAEGSGAVISRHLDDRWVPRRNLPLLTTDPRIRREEHVLV